MNRKTLAVVLAVTIVLIVAAAMAVNRRESAVTPEVQLPKLLAGVDAKIRDAAKITIERNAESITLEKKDDRWTVVENEGFWASDEKIRAILSGFAQFEVEEQKTGNPDMYAKLDVNDPKDSDSKSARVTAFDAAGKEIASVIVGRMQGGSGATQKRYVRVGDDKHAYLVKTPLSADGNKESFTQRELMALKPERVTGMELYSWKDPAAFTASREATEGATWTIADLPENMEVAVPTILEGIPRQFENLSQSGVKKNAAFFDEYTSKTLLTLKTNDGLKVSFDMRADTAENFHTLVKAEADDKAAGFKPEVVKEAEEINKQLDGFVFKVNRGVSNSIAIEKANIVAEKKKPAELKHILVAWKDSAAGAAVERTKEEAYARAQELQGRAKSDPATFDDLANGDSDDKATSANGGLLDQAGIDALGSGFVSATSMLEVNSISDIIETPFGYHIVKRTK